MDPLKVTETNAKVNWLIILMLKRGLFPTTCLKDDFPMDHLGLYLMFLGLEGKEKLERIILGLLCFIRTYNHPVHLIKWHKLAIVRTWYERTEKPVK